MDLKVFLKVAAAVGIIFGIAFAFAVFHIYFNS